MGEAMKKTILILAMVLMTIVLTAQTTHTFKKGDTLGKVLLGHYQEKFGDCPKTAQIVKKMKEADFDVNFFLVGDQVIWSDTSFVVIRPYWRENFSFPNFILEKKEKILVEYNERDSSLTQPIGVRLQSSDGTEDMYVKADHANKGHIKSSPVRSIETAGGKIEQSYHFSSNQATQAAFGEKISWSNEDSSVLPFGIIYPSGNSMLLLDIFDSPDDENDLLWEKNESLSNTTNYLTGPTQHIIRLNIGTDKNVKLTLLRSGNFIEGPDPKSVKFFSENGDSLDVKFSIMNNNFYELFINIEKENDIPTIVEYKTTKISSFPNEENIRKVPAWFVPHDSLSAKIGDKLSLYQKMVNRINDTRYDRGSKEVVNAWDNPYRPISSLFIFQKDVASKCDFCNMIAAIYARYYDIPSLYCTGIVETNGTFVFSNDTMHAGNMAKIDSLGWYSEDATAGIFNPLGNVDRKFGTGKMTFLTPSWNFKSSDTVHITETELDSILVNATKEGSKINYVFDEKENKLKLFIVATKEDSISSETVTKKNNVNNESEISSFHNTMPITKTPCNIKKEKSNFVLQFFPGILWGHAGINGKQDELLLSHVPVPMKKPEKMDYSYSYEGLASARGYFVKTGLGYDWLRYENEKSNEFCSILRPSLNISYSRIPKINYTVSESNCYGSHDYGRYETKKTTDLLFLGGNINVISFTFFPVKNWNIYLPRISAGMEFGYAVNLNGTKKFSRYTSLYLSFLIPTASIEALVMHKNNWTMLNLGLPMEFKL